MECTVIFHPKAKATIGGLLSKSNYFTVSDTYFPYYIVLLEVSIPHFGSNVLLQMIVCRAKNPYLYKAQTSMPNAGVKGKQYNISIAHILLY